MELREVPDQIPLRASNVVSYYEGRAIRRRSFPDFAKDVGAVAERLARWGVGAGATVGILGDNSYAWVVHDLALLKLGALSVALPPAELGATPIADLAAEWGLHLLCAATKFLPPERPTWVARLEIDVGDEVSEARHAPPHQLGHDVFTLAFSSGTSGRVKCLKMSARGVVETIARVRAVFQLQLDDAILIGLPLSNFQQRTMVYAAIAIGFDLCIAEPARILHALRDGRPTLLAGPPALFESVERRFDALPRVTRLGLRAVSRGVRSFLPLPIARRALRRIFAAVHDGLGGRMRLMLVGSAPSRVSTLAFFEMAGIDLFEVYGVTEVGFVAWNHPRANRRGTVGKPVHPEEVSLGPNGEVFVTARAPQSTGYFRRGEDEAASTFLPDGAVATGDVGRFDADGYLTLTGRTKEIIVTHAGYKFQPEEIEKRIDAIRGVRHAVVFGGGAFPVVTALVSIDPAADPQAERAVREATDAMNATLPSAARVDKLVIVRAPLTPGDGLTQNLKVDRRAVLARFERELLQARARDAGRTPAADAS